MQDNMGINEERMNKLIMDIYSYAERMSKTLDQVSNVVDQTKNFYDSDDAVKYRNRFNAFKSNFVTVNKNIVSYANDLIILKNRYSLTNQNMSHTVKLETIKINDIK